MDKFCLQGASYCRFNKISIEGSLTEGKLAEAISLFLNRNIDSFTVPLSEGGRIPHILLSTSISKGFNESVQSWPKAVNSFKQNMKFPPTQFVNAYECAGWGYALRLLSKYYEKHSYVLISILDLNLEQLSFWEESEAWGSSGFGVSTVLLKIGDSNALKVAKSVSSNPMADFCMNIKRHGKAVNTEFLATPFFPLKTQKLNDRILKSFNRLDDRHETMGHCFGSDPWISIIKTGVELQGTSILAGSLAYSGYWCMLGLDVDENASLSYLESDFIISVGTDLIDSDDCIYSHKDLERVSYELVSSPVRSTLIESLSLKLPLKTNLDFKSFSNINFSSQCFVTPYTKYLNLQAISETILKSCDFMVVRIPAPATIPMPNVLLSENVFCCLDSEYFLGDFIISDGAYIGEVASLSDRSFIPYIDPNGDNTLTITSDCVALSALTSEFDSTSYRRILE
jgi:hypothetical protein